MVRKNTESSTQQLSHGIDDRRLWNWKGKGHTKHKSINAAHSYIVESKQVPSQHLFDQVKAEVFSFSRSSLHPSWTDPQRLSPVLILSISPSLGVVLLDVAAGEKSTKYKFLTLLTC